jgi:hypothetical protein
VCSQAALAVGLKGPLHDILQNFARACGPAWANPEKRKSIAPPPPGVNAPGACGYLHPRTECALSVGEITRSGRARRQSPSTRIRSRALLTRQCPWHAALRHHVREMCMKPAGSLCSCLPPDKKVRFCACLRACRTSPTSTVRRARDNREKIIPPFFAALRATSPSSLAGLCRGLIEKRPPRARPPRTRYSAKQTRVDSERTSTWGGYSIACGCGQKEGRRVRDQEITDQFCVHRLWIAFTARTARTDRTDV